MDCYVDADFAGFFGVEDPTDPISVKSRTGYVIMIANCPLLWASKLQQEISLSTQESEHVALSSSLRDVIPIQNLVKDVMAAVGLGVDKMTFVCESTLMSVASFDLESGNGNDFSEVTGICASGFTGVVGKPL